MEWKWNENKLMKKNSTRIYEMKTIINFNIS